MQIVSPMNLAALGLGAAFTVVWGVADPMAAFAEVRMIEADGYYIMGDGPEENPAVAKERARADAKRAAGEKAGVFVESISEVQMGELTRDEIRTISSNVMEVQEAEVTPEVMGGSVIRFHCHIVARVDSSNITAQLQQDRAKLDEAVERNKTLEAELARINEELTDIKSRYVKDVEAERLRSAEEMRQNERKFEALQWYEKGLPYSDEGNAEKAIECYRKSVDLNPKFGDAWLMLGWEYASKFQEDKAIPCFFQAEELGLGGVEIIKNSIEYGASDVEIARICEKFAADHPQNGDVLAYLGRVYSGQLDNSHMQDFPKAIAAAAKAVALDPTNADYRGELGKVYIRSQDYAHAIECYRSAVELAPDITYYWIWLAKCYEESGDNANALACYQKIAALEPKEGIWWGHMGRVFHALGRYQEAVDAYDRALESYPDSKEYRKGRDEAAAKI